MLVFYSNSLCQYGALEIFAVCKDSYVVLTEMENENDSANQIDVAEMTLQK